jgi:hypothetical protein
MDLHRCRSVPVRMSEDGRKRHLANHKQPGGAGGGDQIGRGMHPKVVPGGTLRLVLVV